jgi:hypothetical protein
MLSLIVGIVGIVGIGSIEGIHLSADDRRCQRPFGEI